MSQPDEIPAISYIAEPLLIATILTWGTWFNRRSSSSLTSLQRRPVLFPQAPKTLPVMGRPVPVPDNSVYRLNWGSRVLARFPFLLEVWYWLLTYWVYQIARACQALTMGPSMEPLSRAHSLFLLRTEIKLGIDIELALQRFILNKAWLLWLSNKTYAMIHIPFTTLFISYTYHSLLPTLFQSIRRTLVLSNCLAFVVFSSWPCMPPRLLGELSELGVGWVYVDTLHAGKAASIWTTNKFQNQLAAFPSLHFGYSFVIGVSLFCYSPHRVLRGLGLLYPFVILFVIMATANHYLLDAVGGFLVSLVAWKWNGVLLNLRVVEECYFRLIHTEKPLDKALFSQAVAAGEAGGGTSPLLGRMSGGSEQEGGSVWKEDV